MQKISLKEAYDRLKEVQNDYCEASFLEKSAKGEEKNLLQNKMEVAIIRTRIIFDDCPELSNIVDDFLLAPIISNPTLTCSSVNCLQLI